MVTRTRVWTIVVAAAIVAALAYLYDPPWLIDQTTGLRPWAGRAGEPRYRWSGGHASFFVPSNAAAVEIPLSTSFDEKDSRPMMVTITVDDRLAARVVLSDAGWTRVRVTLPPPGARRVRRIDVRTNVVREDNHGVRIGEVVLVPRVADKLLWSPGGGAKG
jgi:hypothetical protein